jgi:hypothetical protein
MAHWAELDENNVVIRVLVGDNEDPAGDEGYSWIVNNFGGRWLKTSYNTLLGKRRDPETNNITDELGFRGNFAGLGYVYNQELDAFIPPKPFESWILNEEKYCWKSPIPYPQDGNSYFWSEEDIEWKIEISNI